MKCVKQFDKIFLIVISILVLIARSEDGSAGKENPEVIQVLPSELDPDRVDVGVGGDADKEHVLQSLKLDVHADNIANWPPKDVQLTDLPSKWPGHLKPLGSSGRTRETDIYFQFPASDVFSSQLYQKMLPGLFGNAITESFAFKQWQTDEYFLKYPHVSTTWVTTIDKEGVKKPDVSFKQFIQNAKTQYSHLQEGIPSFLLGDLQMPDVLACDRFQDRLSYHELLFTVSEFHGPLKYRSEDSITCVVSGQMDIVFTPPTPLITSINYSDVNVQEVDYDKFPSLREVEYYAVTIRAGNCIFLPNKWFYQENTAANRTIAVTVAWEHVTSSEMGNCSNVTEDGQNSLYNYKFKNMAMADHMENVLLHYFANYFSDGRELDFTAFKKEVKQDATLLDNMTGWTREYSDITKELFEVLDINSDEVWSPDDLDSVTPEILKEIKGLLEDRVADFEDIMVDQQDAKKQKKDQEAKKEMLVDSYMKNLENLVKETVDEVKKDPEGLRKEIKNAQQTANRKMSSSIEEKFKEAGQNYDAELKDMMKQLQGLMSSADEANKLMKDLEEKVDKDEKGGKKSVQSMKKEEL